MSSNATGKHIGYVDDCLREHNERETKHGGSRSVLHWTFITPKDGDFDERADCECCRATHFVEVLYKCESVYQLRRLGVRVQCDDEPKAFITGDTFRRETIQHPYVGHKRLDDYFYNQFVKALSRGGGAVSGRLQRTLSKPVAINGTLRTPDTTPIVSPNDVIVAQPVESWFGTTCRMPGFVKRRSSKRRSWAHASLGRCADSGASSSSSSNNATPSATTPLSASPRNTLLHDSARGGALNSHAELRRALEEISRSSIGGGNAHVAPRFLSSRQHSCEASPALSRHNSNSHYTPSTDCAVPEVKKREPI